MNIFSLTLSTTDLWLLGVCGTVIMTWIGFLLNSTLNRLNRFNQAADLFRTRLLTELERYYPNIHSREEVDYTKLRETIPKVERIAAEFSHFLKGTTKKNFQKTVVEYCNFCRNISRAHDMADTFYPCMRKTDGSEILNVENLSRHVDYLLSFAHPK